MLAVVLTGDSAPGWEASDEWMGSGHKLFRQGGLRDWLLYDKVYVVSVLQLPDEVSLVSRYMQMMLLE